MDNKQSLTCGKSRKLFAMQKEQNGMKFYFVHAAHAVAGI